MRFSKTEPGVIVSGLAHVALLAATLIAFSDTKTFEDAQETVPVDVITGEQFNQITQGEKTAEKVLPKPSVQVQKQADVPEPKPRPPEVEAQKDVPTPPPPLKRIPDPGEDRQPKQAPAPPTPPQKVAEQPPVPTPPVRPPPPPPTPEARPTPPPPEDAEAVEPPKPQPRPKDPKPEPKPEKAEITPPLPKVRPAPKEEPKPALDRTAIAKLLDQKAATEPPKPASKPKSGDETTDQKPRMSTSEISRLLSKDAPSQKASTGREVSQTASIGAPTANAAHMSPSLWGQLDGMMQDQYKQCWSYLGLGAEARYVPQIRVQFQPDGRLSAEPALLNPPSDPGLRSLAESAMRAVRRCNPLKIPAQFAPYYDQWKGRILRFDPQEMQG